MALRAQVKELIFEDEKSLTVLHRLRRRTHGESRWAKRAGSEWLGKGGLQQVAGGGRQGGGQRFQGDPGESWSRATPLTLRTQRHAP